MKIFDHYLHFSIVVLGVAELIVGYGAIVSACFLLENVFGLFQGNLAGMSGVRAIVWTLVLFACLLAMGLYRVALRSSFSGVIARILVAVVAAFLVTPIIYYIAPSIYAHPSVTGAGAIISFFALVLTRFLFQRTVDEDYFKRRILVLGAGKRAQVFLRLRRRSDRRGFLLVGYVADASDKQSSIPQESRINLTVPLCDFARENRIDEIVISLDDRRNSLPMECLLECRMKGIDVTDVMTFVERATGKVDLKLLSPSWLIFSDGFRRQVMRRILQRVFDIFVSCILLVLTAPIMLIAAIAIFLEDGFPVLYRQCRVGQNNKHFDVLKFRSMRIDAEEDGEALWAAKDDERVTRVGEIIRKLRIDELPQLINVLAGEMSFVGPRPERPEFVEKLAADIPYYMERHRVKPGITGWAQVSYPYGSSVKDAFEKLQFDLYYVKNRSILFDLIILLQTTEVILWQKGSR